MNVYIQIARNTGSVSKCFNSQAQVTYQYIA